MIFAGGLVTYIYFTEITPPNYDAYYQRYVGSSFPRIVGILVLMIGLTLFWGASIFLVYIHWRGESESGGSNADGYFHGSIPERTQFKSDTEITPAHRSESTYVRENYVA